MRILLYVCRFFLLAQNDDGTLKKKRFGFVEVMLFLLVFLFRW